MVIRPVGLFCEHPLQGPLHSPAPVYVEHACPKCDKKFAGEVRRVLHVYRDHVMESHLDLLDECGCCGCYHFPEFDGDCREDWERF